MEQQNEIAMLKAMIADKDAMIAEKDAEIADKDAEIVMHLDFSIKAVTTAVTLLRDNKRWDLAYLLMPILDQLETRRMEVTQMFLPQVADQLYRHKGADTNTTQSAHISVQRYDRDRATGNLASGAMVWAPTLSRCIAGHERSEGELHKDLVHAVLDLHLQVALINY
jgi:hypothetical protein